MDDLDKTTRLINETKDADSSIVTIFDGNLNSRTLDLNEFRKNDVYFGRDKSNDIVISSKLVSGEHGRFYRKNGKWLLEDKGAYKDTGSTNGLIYNNTSIISRVINDGDLIRIDDGIEKISEGVLFVFSSDDSGNEWFKKSVDKNLITIGRDETCDIVFSHVSVSKLHAKIIKEADGYYIVDNKSTNGVIVNDERINSKKKLGEKDVIIIANSKLIFTESSISYCSYKNGVSVDVSNIIIERSNRKKSTITCNNVSLNIEAGQLVAIVGGSGAGKSTLLNCMCGYLKPTSGDIYINGVNLYENFDSVKNLIGYVPQSDIVYDNLTLYDMLMYTAKLRLPKDTTDKEFEDVINKAIDTVKLKNEKDMFIKKLSGGQKKRASIAVELLSDPNLLFLDEPSSGLDPGTERSLMLSLQTMASSGKTVVLVTHSTLQLKLCDKIVFLGKGGNLCFYGSYDEALAFFGTIDIISVYDKITDDSPYWTNKYEEEITGKSKNKQPLKTNKNSFEKTKKNRIGQLKILSDRYIKLVINDKQRLILLLLQAPLLAFLISLVADGEQFHQYEMTKSLLFALSCSAFWLGILNAIQEVCKERSILKREYMTSVSLSSYVLSKVIILSLICLVQSFLLIGVFKVLVGLPEQSIFGYPFLELLLTTFLTAISASSMGIAVSSLFTNADRAMTVAPILLMPQILFSGLIFKLSGITNTISWFAICRWSMEGYGTTADLNNLPLRLQQEGIKIPHEAESFFEVTSSHILHSWLILFLFVVTFLVLARIALSKIKK